ncbi:MerR family transcriptional regulator [Burkholderia alba]|uniref:MerR family transcriptional regulator n=1 Tax=Burkholderia alba TaxID=2683677 RepID=UPI002B05D0C3|nr:MerR family transcriptional regulator [Burkholderia alba]
MKIGELAEKTGLSTSAIRFYEQSGLLSAPPRGANGYRLYTDEAVDRLKLIQMAQRLGFSLDALRMGFARHDGLSKADMLATFDVRLEEVEQLMRTLARQRDDLRALRDTLRESWQAGECPKIDALQERIADAPGQTRKPKRGAAPAAVRTARTG